MTGLYRDDRGQALVAVAIAMAVLLGAVGLGLDWGLSLTQRRISQNAADAAAMGAAKWLSTSVVLSGGSMAFAIDQEQVYCYAKAYADADRGSFAPTGQTTSFVLQYGDGATPTSWTTSASATCPAGSAGTPVPPSTVLVRAISGATYRSTIAALFGIPQITSQAGAKARMTGTIVDDGFKIWPMIRHYNPADFDLGCKKPPCDASSLPPMTFWSSSGSLSDMVYGNFKGLIDYSIWSTRFPVSDQVQQLYADWDRTGSTLAGTSPKPDMSGNCGGPWDTHGDSDPSNNNKQCSITNWFYYPFGGRLSLTEDRVTSVPAGQEAPSDIGPRSAGVCSGSVPGLVAPSCAAGSHSVGDWLETAFGNLGSNVSDLLKQFISEHGKTTARSNDFIPGSKSVKYGKALVMYVYLWDCAETFTSSPAGSQWSLVLPNSGDCSQISDGSGIATIDRVHLFTVAPFTFYEGLIATTNIQGFWGGAFGDPSACQTDPAKCRPLDLFMNTAFLVADD